MHSAKYRSAVIIAAVTLACVATLASCDFLEGLFGSGGDDEATGTPTLVKGLEKAGTFSFSTAARDVVGDGSYAYVATYTYSGTYGGVDVISVANPSSPTRSGYYHPNTSSTSLYPANIAKGGDNVYVDGGNVRIFAKVSVSSPSSPSRVYQKEGTNDVATDIIAEGTTLYYISYSNKCVYIFDVSDTYAPTMGTSYVPSGGEPGAACADSGYFYIRTTGQAVKIAKLNTARTSLTEVGSFSIGENGTGGIAKAGNYLYQQLASNTLQVIDVSDPAAPVLKGTVAMKRTGKLVVSQDCAFVVAKGYVDLYDVGKPGAPAFISTLEDSVMDPSGASISGDVLVVSDGGGGSGKLRCYRLMK